MGGVDQVRLALAGWTGRVVHNGGGNSLQTRPTFARQTCPAGGPLRESVRRSKINKEMPGIETTGIKEAPS